MMRSRIASYPTNHERLQCHRSANARRGPYRTRRATIAQRQQRRNRTTWTSCCAS